MLSGDWSGKSDKVSALRRLRSTAVGTLDKSDGLDGLTSKQQIFVDACFSGLNDTQAYRRAYSAEGMSPGAVGVAAHAVRHDPNVTLKLRELQERRDARSMLASDLTRDWVQVRLMKLADKADKDSVKVTALIALGKTVGIDLFRETTRIEKVERTPEDVDRELERQLKALQPMIEGKANTVEPTPDRRRKPRL